MKKTLMNEVLPTPTPLSVDSVRVRAQRRLETLAKKAAMAGAATTLSACVGYGVVDPLPQPVECTTNDNLDTWVFAGVSSTGDGGTQITVTLSINVGLIVGVRLSNGFVVDGGTLVGDPRFDGTDLASSNNVSITIEPAGNLLVIHTGLTCDDEPRAVDIHVDLATGTATVVDAG